MMFRGLHFFAGSFYLSIILGFQVAPVAAQTSENVAVKSTGQPQISSGAEGAAQAKRQDLFQRMLEQPDDLDTAFEYAALSIQVGDLEAAISTLERMLIFSPGLPRLQLELGLLYYRLAAHETARSYFEAAISGPNVPEEVRAKVQQYLDGIDQAGKKTRVTGQARVGLRYQTNANRGPDGDRIVLNGLAYRLGPLSRADDDLNVYGAGNLHISHKLPHQGTTLEFDLVGYAAKQFQREEFDLVQAEATFGPAFDLGRFGYDNSALGIYGILSGAFLHKNYYATNYGAGTRLVSKLNARTLTSSKIEYRSKNFNNSSTAPRATDRDGHELRAAGSITHIANPMRTYSFSVTGVRSWAARNYLSYTDVTLRGGPSFSFMSPFKDEQKWVLGTALGFLYRSFDAPDPLINANSKQRDYEYFAQASLNIPIKNGFSILAETEYRLVNSNYPTRDHNNFSTTLSLVKIW